jgi:hypothetical protein
MTAKAICRNGNGTPGECDHMASIHPVELYLSSHPVFISRLLLVLKLGGEMSRAFRRYTGRNGRGHPYASDVAKSGEGCKTGSGNSLPELRHADADTNSPSMNDFKGVISGNEKGIFGRRSKLLKDVGNGRRLGVDPGFRPLRKQPRLLQIHHDRTGSGCRSYREPVWQLAGKRRWM